MEVCVPFNISAGQDIISDCGSSTDPPKQTQYESRDLSVSDLETCMNQYLTLEDIEISSSGGNLFPKMNNGARKDKLRDSDKSKSSNSAIEKSFSKCATFPSPSELKSYIDGISSGKKKLLDDNNAEVYEVNGYAESVNQCYSRSISLPTPSKLVSAMKGSREKQGIEPKKLSVTWAPDVYDPIPTSVSHVPSNKNPRHRSDSKKHGKNKQKNGGKSSRGRTKDKKQPRKNSGSTSKLRPVHYDSGVSGFSDSQAVTDDLNVGSPDPFCGSSFLKESVSKMHFTVAEAT